MAQSTEVRDGILRTLYSHGGGLACPEIAMHTGRASSDLTSTLDRLVEKEGLLRAEPIPNPGKGPRKRYYLTRGGEEEAAHLPPRVQIEGTKALPPPPPDGMMKHLTTNLKRTRARDGERPPSDIEIAILKDRVASVLMEYDAIQRASRHKISVDVRHGIPMFEMLADVLLDEEDVQDAWVGVRDGQRSDLDRLVADHLNAELRRLRDEGRTYESYGKLRWSFATSTPDDVGRLVLELMRETGTCAENVVDALLRHAAREAPRAELVAAVRAVLDEYAKSPR